MQNEFSPSYYYSWLRLSDTYQKDFVRLTDKLTEERRSGEYKRENALRSASISMTKAFNEINAINDPDFNPMHFQKSKKELSEKFLSKIENEVSWNLGEKKPLHIEELLSDKTFSSSDEVNEWYDRLIHTKNASNLIKCRETGYNPPNDFECNEREIIPEGDSNSIQKFREKYAEQMKLGSHLKKDFFFFRSNDNPICLFEPHKYNSELITGLCIKPRSTIDGTIYPPKAEIIQFSRRFDSSDGDKWISTLHPMSIPTDVPRPKITSFEDLRYSNARSEIQTKSKLSSGILYLTFDESEFRSDFKDLITKNQIEDYDARMYSRISAQNKRGEGTSEKEFWEYPQD